MLTSATSTGGTTTVVGTLASLADRDYTIELFANDALDPTGYGEGQTYLGSVTAHTGADGMATFSTSIAQDLAGKFLTSTATTPNPGLTPPDPAVTEPGSDTSEFSKGILITATAAALRPT